MGPGQSIAELELGQSIVGLELNIAGSELERSTVGQELVGKTERVVRTTAMVRKTRFRR